jgi:lambda repressor-like predicted transcriptional regulator
MPRRKTNIHPEDLKALVRKTGLSVSDVARGAGLHPSTALHALRRPQPTGNQALANHLGMRLSDLWPEWFKEDGSRIKARSNHPKLNRNKTMCHRQKRLAA